MHRLLHNSLNAPALQKSIGCCRPLICSIATKRRHAAQDVEYLNHTSLKTYFPYMMGGGYVLSADLAAVILGINQQSHGHDLLKFMPNEDVSVGFWLMSVDLRRIDHQRVVSLPDHPCLDMGRRVPSLLLH